MFLSILLQNNMIETETVVQKRAEGEHPENQILAITYLIINNKYNMNRTISLHQQRKKLNTIYNSIIKCKDLPESEFDHLIRLWISVNEKLEEKEQLF